MGGSCHFTGYRFVFLAAVCVLAYLGCSMIPACAEETDSRDAVFPDEPAAHAIYDQMYEALRKADSLSFVSHYVLERRGTVVGDCTYRLWLKKPNHFRIETELTAGGKGGVLIGDGKNAWIHWPHGRPRFSSDSEDAEADRGARFESYMKTPAGLGQHSIGHDQVELLGAGMDFPTIIDPSTFHDGFVPLQDDLDAVRGLGNTVVGTEECVGIEVRLIKGLLNWQFWVSKSDHLPRRLQLVLRVSGREVVREQWSSVRVNTDLPADLFAWKPPEGWTQWTRPDPEDRLLRPGVEAPDFELKSIDGHPMRLSDYRGQVVWFYAWNAT